jgi:hypothetical protein
MPHHPIFRFVVLAISWFVASPLAASETIVVAPASSAAAWVGGTAAEMEHHGAPSIRWEPARAPALSLRPTKTDFTAAGWMRIWIHASAASGDWLNVTVTTRGKNAREEEAGVVKNHSAAQSPGSPSDDPQKEESATVSGLVQISWTGWQEVLLPRRAFEWAPGRRRTNWRAVERIEFSCREGSAPGLVLHFGDVRLGDPQGPRLSDRALLELIDLSRPELSEVRRAADRGDTAAAIKALAAYYRQRRTVKWWFDPQQRDPASVKPDLKSIDAMMADNLTILYRRFPFRGGVADWHLNPTAGKPNQTDEWLWSLNRMGYWKELGDAWWKTGVAKYVNTFIHQLRSWAQAMPMPNMMDEAPGSGWRGLEAGLRADESWPEAWHRFLSAPQFTDDDLILMLKCFAEHGRYLAEHRVPDPKLPSTNHYLISWSGLYTVGVLFPELKPAAQWRGDGRSRLVAALQSSLLADGGWYEFAPGYHRWVLDKAVAAYRLAQLMGDENSFPESYLPMLQRAHEWLAKLMAPDRSLPKVNDTGNTERLTFKPALAQLFPASPLIQWAVSLNHPTGVAGPVAPPPWRSVHLESSGYAVMRSGWVREDNYACFDVGHLGGWHGHQDKLSLMVWSKGRELLFDGGGGTYDKSVFRKYGQQTESHNTVMVDGLNQNRVFIPYVDPIGLDDPATPAPVFVTQPDWDYASGWFVGGYGPDQKPIARHRREVAMVRGEFFLVHDTLTPTDGAAHEYEARWHLKTTKWTQAKAIAGTLTADPGKANLLVVPLATAGLKVREDSAVKSPRLLGWDVERDRDPAPALTVRHTRAGSGPQHFVTLLWPLPAGATNPISSVQRDSDTRWTVAFSSGRKLQVEIATTDASGFSVVDLSPSGEKQESSIRSR